MLPSDRVRVDDFIDFHTEVLVDRHHFPRGEQRSVYEDVDGFTDGPIKLDE